MIHTSVAQITHNRFHPTQPKGARELSTHHLNLCIPIIHQIGKSPDREHVNCLESRVMVLRDLGHVD